MSIAQSVGAPSWGKPREGAHVDLAAHGHATVRRRLRQWERSHRRKAFLTDLAGGIAGVAVGVWGHELLSGDAVASPSITPWVTSVVLVVGWVLALAAHGAYAVRFVGSGNEQYRAVTRAAATVVAITACAAFFLHTPFARSTVLVAVPTMLVVSGVARWGLRQSIASKRRDGLCLQSTLLVGDVRSVRDMADHILRDPAAAGMRIVGACVSDLHDPGVAALREAGVRILGTQHDTLEVVEAQEVEAVAVASNPDMGGVMLRRLGWSLEQQDVDLLISPGIVEVAGPRLTMRPAAGVPMLHVERPVSGGLRYSLKLMADRVGAFFLIALASPVLIGIAVMIKRDSAGPVFFTQDRVGEGGRMFRMIKFRTMVVDAEARLAELEAAGHEANATLFKMRTDPRITRVGAVLRRFSLDELPQLFNVLRGEMSLVGPRPPLTSEVDRYESDAVRRLRVRPGMTGLWQVSGRSDLSWGDSVRLDLWYVDNWSLALDAQILVRTAEAVVRGRGAY